MTFGVSCYKFTVLKSEAQEYLPETLDIGDVLETITERRYILLHRQGCDVCNHLSLFLCVAHYDKLLPGWSHFAQFTISVVNKDSKNSKFSDMLHRFWKEHDWGWKKFMKLPKLQEGFIDDEASLTIKAQVQVIRNIIDVLGALMVLTLKVSCAMNYNDGMLKKEGLRESFCNMPKVDDPMRR